MLKLRMLVPIAAVVGVVFAFAVSSAVSAMTPEESRGRIFKVTVKHSNKCLSTRAVYLPVGGTVQLGRIIISQNTYSNRMDQQFLLFPLDDGTYVISSRASGQVLDIVGNSKGDKAYCAIYPYHGKDNQRFILEEVEDGFCFIKAKHSGKVLDVQAKSKSDNALVYQYKQKQLTDAGNQLFKFEEVGTYQLPSTSNIGPLPIVPLPTNVYDNLPTETMKVVMGETLMPYFVIDEDLPDDKMVQQTPYYKLQKLQS